MEKITIKRRPYTKTNAIKRDELAVRVAGGQNITEQKAKMIIRAFCDTMAQEIGRGNIIYIPKIGFFGHSIRKAGRRRNPNTGGHLEVQSKAYPKMKWARSIKINLKKLDTVEVSHGTESEPESKSNEPEHE